MDILLTITGVLGALDNVYDAHHLIIGASAVTVNIMPACTKNRLILQFS